MTTRRGAHIAHGYTRGDIHELARVAAIRARYINPAAWHDYYDEALSTIHLELAAATERPDPLDLQHAAERAVNNMVRSRRYLSWNPRPTPDHAEHTVERVAVHQILDTLTPSERAAIHALAYFEHHTTAAEYLGITGQALHARLIKARRRFLPLWHYPDTPAPRYRQDRRRTGHRADVCGNGHPRTPENTGVRSAGDRRGERYCKPCSRESNARSLARRKAVAA